MLTTDDGAELRTESLIYRGDKQLATASCRSSSSARRCRGTATGFEYHGEDGALELHGDVLVRAEPAGQAAPGDPQPRAVLLREEGTMRFTDGVTVNQAADVLTTDRFELDFGDDHVIYRARAIDDVVLQTSSALTPGRRRRRARAT